MTAVYEVYAIRLGSVDRPARDNFLRGPRPDAPMRMDFDMWLLRCDDRVIAVDTGFSREAGDRRGRVLERTPAEALEALGVDAARVGDLVITHLHYDHAGNVADFPNARIWIQRAEVEYVTGRSMRHAELSHFFEVDDVVGIVRAQFAGRVVQIDGTVEIADGVELHRLGGHTPGLQAVRVRTPRGWVVLASDALHYRANLDERNPFPGIADVVQMSEGFDLVHALADTPDHIVPGHDPIVFAQYPAAGADVAALHLSPTTAA